MRRAAIVVVYALVFWVALPAGLWRAATNLDHALGLGDEHSLAAGGLVVAMGLALVTMGTAALWREGGGLPVSALPPLRLARSGPFRHVRHPIYLGFNLSVLGAGLLAGSPSLTFVVAPALVPLWIVYARLEERGLRRRFGRAYRRYERQVGLLPRLRLYGATRLAARALLPLQVEGRDRVPLEGPALLVANHACYLDPAYVGLVTRRPVHFLTTAEAYRPFLLGAYCRRMYNVPVRRYRSDPAACREVVRLLEDGELVGLFPEGQRSVLGDYQGSRPDVARVASRLGAPAIPVAISGSYDCGPRWAGALRARPVVVRVGPPIEWRATEPAQAIDAALRALIAEDPQPVHLEPSFLPRLDRVLWRCPRCSDEAAWQAAALLCRACGVRYRSTPEGRLEAGDGAVRSLADLGRAVRTAAEVSRIVVPALGWREPDPFGPIRPLEPLGGGLLEIEAAGLRFGGLALRHDELTSISTERADTLQVAAAGAMWQFRPTGGSVFRLQTALERWRGALRAPVRRLVACQ